MNALKRRVSPAIANTVHVTMRLNKAGRLGNLSLTVEYCASTIFKMFTPSIKAPWIWEHN